MSPSKNDIVNQVKSLIKQAELAGAIDVLVDFLKDNDPVYYQEVMILSFRLNDYNKQFNLGLTADDTVKNKITKAVLDLVKEIETGSNQKAKEATFSKQIGLNFGNVILYDKKVIAQYLILQENSEAHQLEGNFFIQILSELFNRGTFRYEPCIRGCDTQFWQRRWISAFDTKRLIELMLPQVQNQLDENQRTLLFEIKKALFKYCDAMGAFLFEAKVDDTYLDQYYLNNSFPKGRKINFFDGEPNSGGKISDSAVRKINQPLRKSISQMNQLASTISDSNSYSELGRCKDCVCK